MTWPRKKPEQIEAFLDKCLQKAILATCISHDESNVLECCINHRHEIEHRVANLLGNIKPPKWYSLERLNKHSQLQASKI